MAQAVGRRDLVRDGQGVEAAVRVPGECALNVVATDVGLILGHAAGVAVKGESVAVQRSVRAGCGVLAPSFPGVASSRVCILALCPGA